MNVFGGDIYCMYLIHSHGLGPMKRWQKHGLCMVLCIGWAVSELGWPRDATSADILGKRAGKEPESVLNCCH